MPPRAPSRYQATGAPARSSVPLPIAVTRGLLSRRLVHRRARDRFLTIYPPPSARLAAYAGVTTRGRTLRVSSSIGGLNRPAFPEAPSSSDEMEPPTPGRFNSGLRLHRPDRA